MLYDLIKRKIIPQQAEQGKALQPEEEDKENEEVRVIIYTRVQWSIKEIEENIAEFGTLNDDYSHGNPEEGYIQITLENQ